MSHWEIFIPWRISRAVRRGTRGTACGPMRAEAPQERRVSKLSAVPPGRGDDQTGSAPIWRASASMIPMPVPEPGPAAAQRPGGGCP